MTQKHTEEQLKAFNVVELRQIASKLGIIKYYAMSKDELVANIISRELEGDDPADFSDLPEKIQPAPDKEQPSFEDEPDPEPSKPEPPKEPEPKPEPLKEPEPQVVLTADELAVAIKLGDSAGLPIEQHKEARLMEDGSILLSVKPKQCTAVIAGHTVDCSLEISVRLVKWDTQPRSEAKGKCRLMNDIDRIVINGQLTSLKAGMEFYPHQYPLEIIKNAGGSYIWIK